MDQFEEIREAIDLLKEIQSIEDPTARSILTQLVLNKLEDPKTKLNGSKEFPTTLSLGQVVELISPSPEKKTKPQSRKVTPPKKFRNQNGIRYRVLQALENFPEGVSGSELSEVIDGASSDLVCRELSRSFTQGLVTRSRGPRAGDDVRGRHTQMYVYFPKSEKR